jgi:phosphatidylglycerol:prolipoprotein diacylglycerol transferase
LRPRWWAGSSAQSPGNIFSRGGLVWYGGFVGGAVAVILNGWRLRVPLRWTMQLAAPALAAAYALGRVGCFLVNDDYGRPSSLPWAMKFPRGLPATTAGNMQQLFGIPVPPGTDPSTVLAVHPTQLYETGLTFIILAILYRLRPKLAATPGQLFFVWLALAGVERFIVEIFRAKDDRLLGMFSVAQLISVLLIATAAVFYTALQRRAAAAPPVRGKVARA